MKIITNIFVMLVSSIALAGGGSSIGPANPAAVNCGKLQGTLEPYSTPQGEGANCVIEAWHLFDEMFKRGLVKEHHYPVPPRFIPNPSAVNCNDIQGNYINRTTPEGDVGYCVVEEWTLFRVIDVTRE